MSDGTIEKKDEMKGTIDRLIIENEILKKQLKTSVANKIKLIK